jgi:hypothetical protein
MALKINAAMVEQFGGPLRLREGMKMVKDLQV